MQVDICCLVLCCAVVRIKLNIQGRVPSGGPVHKNVYSLYQQTWSECVANVQVKSIYNVVLLFNFMDLRLINVSLLYSHHRVMVDEMKKAGTCRERAALVTGIKTVLLKHP